MKIVFSTGFCSSLLCGRTKEVEVGGPGGASGALALALVRPAAQSESRAPCQLRLAAPDAAAFTVRLIDVKVSKHLFTYFLPFKGQNLKISGLKHVTMFMNSMCRSW